MAHYNDPRSLGTVDTGKIIGQPFVLLVVFGVLVGAIDGAKWSTIGNVCLVGLGRGLVSSEICNKRKLRAVGKIGLTVYGDKVGKTVIKGVPKVPHATSFASWHSETVLISRKISVIVSEKLLGILKMELEWSRIFTSEKVDN